MTLDDIKKDDEKLFILSRFMYKIGEPILVDLDYDILLNKMIEENKLKEYTSRTYDDDPVPYEILSELHWISKIPNFGSNSEYAKFLEEEKSLSIRAVVSYKEVFDYFMAHLKERLILSLKVDGANSKSYYKKALQVTLSRGRHGKSKSLDYTKGAVNILPLELEGSEDGVKVFAEVFVDPEYLPTLREKYPKDFKTPKSSAISMLRVSEYDKEDYNNLVAIAFYAEGLKNVENISDILQYLNSHGFLVVPYILIKPGSYPTEFNKFEKWIKNILNNFYSEVDYYASDGVVVDVDKIDYVAEEVNQYSNRNIAIKLGPWEYKRYKGKVIGITLAQQRVDCSCVLQIEPVITEDGCTVTNVNAYNLSILKSNNIKIGSTIEFERSSSTYSTLIYR